MPKLNRSTQINSVVQMVQIIRLTREQKNMTQVQLADCLGVSQKKIAMLENLNSSPKFEFVLKVLKVLEIDLTLAQEVHLETSVDEIIWPD